MKNGRSIILSLLLVLSFLYCMAMAASAEGEDDPLSQDSGKTDISFEESVSYQEISDAPSEESPSGEPVERSGESSEESLEESVSDASDESSFDPPVESSDESSLDPPVESSDESSAVSYPESSDESSQDSSDISRQESSEQSSEPDISQTEQSSQQSSQQSHEESSKTEQSSKTEESSHTQQSTPESSSESQQSPESSDNSETEASKGTEASQTSEQPSQPSREESDHVQLTAPRKDPLNWMAGIGTVIPSMKESSDSSDSSYEPQDEKSLPYSDIDIEISYETVLREIPFSPIVESEPVGINAIPVRNSRALLIGIIIFSLIGMGVTLSLIIILRKNGFLPARGGKGRRTAM